jgi:hypothetical protein
MQDVAESVTAVFEQKFKVSEKIVKIHKEARDYWLSPETMAAMKDNSFRSEWLRLTCAAVFACYELKCISPFRHYKRVTSATQQKQDRFKRAWELWCDSHTRFTMCLVVSDGHILKHKYCWRLQLQMRCTAVQYDIRLAWHSTCVFTSTTSSSVMLLLCCLSVITLAGNLGKSMNMTHLFDNIFANSAGKLLSGPRAAAATAAAAGNVLGQHPMRTLLAKARQGAGQPVSLKLHGSLDQALKTVGAFGGAAAETLGAAATPGSIMEILRKDPGTGQRLKQMADALQKAMEAMRSGDFSKLG